MGLNTNTRKENIIYVEILAQKYTISGNNCLNLYFCAKYIV